ncbi:hypothetical protein HPB49_001818 [Dermacentor silvarum]|uniref:Uncharacterized protein n=1 Tax=Dermacentor silvarum TaxID=543639 RepID=A0ACB8DMB4_DERSI|nr:hypothetical protein HPB49_001818 [Dermacentor silvarum]
MHWCNEETETEANPKVPSLTRPFAEGYLETFNDLCRGEKIRNATEEKDLRCYLSVPHPYFRIGPVKMEVMSLDPYIVQFYDVIWPEEIRAIRKLGDPMLSRATVRETTEAMVSHGRISQVAWLSPDTDPLLERVNERVAMLTGLSTDYEAGDSEIIQYNSYGPGGHYEPHHDYLLGGLTEEQLEQVDEDEKFTGDRIATFMFYGSAAFWYNMREDGSYDVNTLHGACSVAHGTKQVHALSRRMASTLGPGLSRSTNLRRGPVCGDVEIHVLRSCASSDEAFLLSTLKMFDLDETFYVNKLGSVIMYGIILR